jgi:hypothetical protein
VSLLRRANQKGESGEKAERTRRGGKKRRKEEHENMKENRRIEHNDWEPWRIIDTDSEHIVLQGFATVWI